MTARGVVESIIAQMRRKKSYAKSLINRLGKIIDRLNKLATTEEDLRVEMIEICHKLDFFEAARQMGDEARSRRRAETGGVSDDTFPSNPGNAGGRTR